MLPSLLARPLLAAPLRQARLVSHLATPAQPASDSHPVPARPTSPAHLSYHVRRNSRGSIPVYTDIRNGGSRYLVLIRNVQGNIDVRPVSLIHLAFRYTPVLTVSSIMSPSHLAPDLALLHIHRIRVLNSVPMSHASADLSTRAAVSVPTSLPPHGPMPNLSAQSHYAAFP